MVRNERSLCAQSVRNTCPMMSKVIRISLLVNTYGKTLWFQGLDRADEESSPGKNRDRKDRRHRATSPTSHVIGFLPLPSCSLCHGPFPGWKATGAPQSNNF